MARPSAFKEQEKRDTLYWCQLIKSYSGLSDPEIEKRLALTPDPNGRQFQRWRSGKRAMTLNDIQLLVQKARKMKLLPSRSGIVRDAEFRISSNAELASKMREARTSEAMRIHKAHKALCKAIDGYRIALKQAKNTLAFRLVNDEMDEFNHHFLDQLAVELKHHHFVPLLVG